MHFPQSSRSGLRLRPFGFSSNIAAVWLGVASILLIAFGVSAEPARGQDALDRALALESVKRSELGWELRGYWSRFPMDIPYKLRHFDALMAEPLATVTFARTAGEYAKSLLSAEALAKVPDRSDGALYKLVHSVGVERRFGALRSYSANLTPPKGRSLTDAILDLHVAGGRSVEFVSFGSTSPYPKFRAKLDRMVAVIPKDARPALTDLVYNLIDAHRWIVLSMRRVNPKDLERVQRRFDLTLELTDGLEYMPEIDDVALALDEASLWYGGLKAMAAMDEARIALGKLSRVAPFTFDWHTPLGWVRIRGGGNDVIPSDGALLIVDLGGNDRYNGGAAASGPGLPVSVVLDVGGNDTYTADHGPAQGAGMGGVGVLVDLAGNDKYIATQCAQGYGQMGLGVLADLGGNDHFTSRYASQGAAIFGVGVLIDATGKDRYEIQSDGQGFGGPGGVGTLVDYAGNDQYTAIRSPKVTERPSYHSKLKISVSNAQGVGLGRRGDGGDGHSWAGGLGQLIDVSGNDQYSAGNWSMGTGYWFGTGILHDLAGNDTYDGVVWSQGTGAHFCIGALIDEGGNDVHKTSQEHGRNSLAFGHDFCIALLVNMGGNDSYSTAADGIGYAINRSYALFLEIGGNDTYRIPKGASGLGVAPHDPAYRKRGTHTYFADANSLALFLDVGGDDDYPVGIGKDNGHWLDPKGAPNREDRNFNIGLDLAEGEVSFIPRLGR